MNEVEQYILRTRLMVEGLDKEPIDVYRRTARYIAQNDENLENQLFRAMSEHYIMPNYPMLRNSGTKHPQLFACYVLPIEDSLDSIFHTLYSSAKIFSLSGGVGINFSPLRPRGSPISKGGYSTGSVSFMRLFDTMGDVVVQGGQRRSAFMSILDEDHADLDEFITAKNEEGVLKNMNLSVRLKSWNKDVVEKVAQNSWKNGEPSLLFGDHIQNGNPLKDFGSEIIATNPCGEQPLEGYECCALASVNLAKLYDESKNDVDFDKLRYYTQLCGVMLDRAIDLCSYPLDEIRKKVMRNRKIGVGVMGWHELLIRLGIPYESEDALKLIDEIGFEMYYTLTKMSEELEGGNEQIREWLGRKNVCLMSIAPTGTISVLCGTTPSIEPKFANEYIIKSPRGDIKYKVIEGDKLATEISWEWHILHQAHWQKYVDAGVSKTINMTNEATVDDVISAYEMAYSLKCKGLTIYRQGSRKEEAIVVNNINNKDNVLRYGKTAKVRTYYGNMYVICNYSDKTMKNPFEVFIEISKSGTVISAFTEAVGRLISLALRKGIPIEEVCEQLEGIKAETQFDPTFKYVHSIPDGIAKALTYINEINNHNNEDGTIDNGELCPHCHKPLTHSEGCLTCTCGFSKC